MRKNQCKLKIFIHNFYSDGTEGEETHFISYYKKPIINFQQNLKHKKNKSVNLQNNELNIYSIFPINNNNKNTINKNNNNKNQIFKKKKSSSSQKKNSNNTTNKDSYQNSIKSVSINKFSKSYNNDINNNIYNNNNNIDNIYNILFKKI